MFMETLAYLMPQTEKHPCGSVRSVPIAENRLLKVVYINEASGFFSRIGLRRHIKDCVLFENSAASGFRNEKVYYDGTALVYAHINELICLLCKTSPVVIFTSEYSDLLALEGSITALKDISILTVPQLCEEFDSFLLERFGMAGAVHSAVPLSGKTAVIMPSGIIFSAEGARRVIDLSDKAGIYRAVSFRVPEIFKGAGAFLSAPDALETAMRFFGIDLSEAKIKSAKSDKVLMPAAPNFIIIGRLIKSNRNKSSVIPNL